MEVNDTKTTDTEDAKTRKKEKKSLRKRLVKVVGIVLGLVIIWFMLKEIIENWADIVPYLANMNLPLFIVSIAIYAAAFLCIAYNWTYILWSMEPTLTKREYLNIYLVSVWARYIPGGIWNILGKGLMCIRAGVSKQNSSVSIVLEYVFQISSSGICLVLLLPLLLKDGMNVWLSLLYIAAVVVMLIILPPCVNLGIRIVGKVLKENCSDLHLSRKFIYQVIGRYLVMWMVTGIGLMVMVSAFSETSLLQGVYLMLSYPVSWVVGFLSPSPNGMGIREAVLGFLLRGSGSQIEELVLLIIAISRIWTIFGEIVAFAGFKIYYWLTRNAAVSSSAAAVHAAAGQDSEPGSARMNSAGARVLPTDDGSQMPEEQKDLTAADRNRQEGGADSE